MNETGVFFCVDRIAIFSSRRIRFEEFVSSLLHPLIYLNNLEILVSTERGLVRFFVCDWSWCLLPWWGLEIFGAALFGMKVSWEVEVERFCNCSSWELGLRLLLNWLWIPIYFLNKELICLRNNIYNK